MCVFGPKSGEYVLLSHQAMYVLRLSSIGIHMRLTDHGLITHGGREWLLAHVSDLSSRSWTSERNASLLPRSASRLAVLTVKQHTHITIKSERT